MAKLTAKRTLVKSPPELWSELTDIERLQGHLGAFGDIRITRLEPEQTVAWEGERASGTVSIDSAGWGTKVTLTAALPDGPREQPKPDLPPAPPRAAPRPRRLWTRLLARLRPAPAPTRAPLDPERARAALEDVLGALGRAHHRPFSRV